ncbi:hypothetical protein [Pseudomonas sp. SST3]|jgi:hypothetical protein|uniref:hypothetical protein n=1 Tax=Pseudomonas sp. SST3 TaxID=2267882 RepID=UPI000DFDC99A|nr:hypothetical protein [Pseudomonas sp. SST3]NKQ12666.1 hypothetical protein [Pseudomonas sp. SST3]
MPTAQTTTPQQACENILIDEKRYNTERGILRSENAVIDRLLTRSLELKPAYGELHEKLHSHPQALRVFLRLLLSTAAFWNLERIAKSRAQRGELVETNRQIARKADELAQLLVQRSRLHDTSGFSSRTHYHVCDVIEAAAGKHSLFNAYVKERLDALCGQFDLKYWPSLDQLVRAVAADAESATLAATDPLTLAATVAARSSRADFFKALFAAIKENSAQTGGQLPEGFRLTDGTLASLANCALDLGPDELADSAYVKRLRQHLREDDR